MAIRSAYLPASTVPRSASAPSQRIGPSVPAYSACAGGSPYSTMYSSSRTVALVPSNRQNGGMSLPSSTSTPACSAIW